MAMTYSPKPEVHLVATIYSVPLSALHHLWKSSHNDQGARTRYSNLVRCVGRSPTTVISSCSRRFSRSKTSPPRRSLTEPATREELLISTNCMLWGFLPFVVLHFAVFRTKLLCIFIPSDCRLPTSCISSCNIGCQILFLNASAVAQLYVISSLLQQHSQDAVNYLRHTRQSHIIIG
jgi:hypothetical protein